MDETNTANSSAKLAASAASSKQLADAPTTNTKSSTHVKLLIKSSNQQYDDQVIESDLSWTVRKLKVHLSVVYPNKPVSTSEFYLGIPNNIQDFWGTFMILWTIKQMKRTQHNRLKKVCNGRCPKHHSSDVLDILALRRGYQNIAG